MTPFPALLSIFVPTAATAPAGVDLRYAGEAVFLVGLAWGIMKWLKRTIFEIEEPPEALDDPTTLGEYPVEARPKRKPRPTPPVPRASSGKPAPAATQTPPPVATPNSPTSWGLVAP